MLFRQMLILPLSKYCSYRTKEKITFKFYFCMKLTHSSLVPSVIVSRENAFSGSKHWLYQILRSCKKGLQGGGGGYCLGYHGAAVISQRSLLVIGGCAECERKFVKTFYSATFFYQQLTPFQMHRNIFRYFSFINQNANWRILDGCHS